MSGVGKKERRFGVMRLQDAMQYRLPLAGVVSILHRISGLLMFALLPFVLYLFDRSLASEYSFFEFKQIVSGICPKIIILVLSWAFLHHFCAGIRHLVMDFHFGLDKDSGRKTAVSALVVSLTLTALVGAKLFGVF
jgi:succinate dehydrogenase / fumarate reductase, cytochrome b subunit